MRVVVVGLLAVIACGGAPPVQPAAPPPPAPPPPPPESNEVIAAKYCAQIQRLAQTCEPLAKLTGDPASCPADVVTEIHNTNGAAVPIMRCVIDNHDCNAALQCIVATTADMPKQFRACDDRAANREFTVVGYPRAEWEHRNGAGATKFSDARSTKARPIEMCGIDAANEWLMGLRCDDGSQPIKDHGDAERDRPGNLGPGGRCGSIIDDYRVPCPERRYEILIDAYVCPLDPRA
jgi:hypothetical protein